MIERFGSDEAVIAALSGKDIYDIDGLDAMMTAVEKLESSDYIASVSGMPTVYRNTFGGEDYEALIDEMTSTPFYHGLFVNEAGTVAGILIEPKVLDPNDPNLDVHHSRVKLIEDIESALKPLQDMGYRVDLVGEPMMNVAVDRISNREVMTFFPLAVLISFAVLLLLLRSLRAALVVIICAAIAQLITLSLLVAGDLSLNVVTKSYPIILWVLSLASCIHLVARYQQFFLENNDRRNSVLLALEDVRFACYLAAITNAFGFFSLFTANTQPIRELGLIVGLGLVLAAIINMNIAPFLIIWLRTPSSRKALGNREAFFRNMADYVIRHAVPVVVFFTIVSCWGFYGVTQVSVNEYTLKFLPEDSPTVDSYLYVAENLTGMYSMEIILDVPDTWLDDKYWPKINEISEELMKSEHVPRVVTPLQFLKKLNQWDHDFDPEYYKLPENTAQAHELYDVLEDEDKEGLRRMVSPDNKQIRLTVLVNSTDNRDFTVLVDKSEEMLKSLPEGMSGHVTGRIKRMREMADALVQSQINSFSVAFILIFFPIFFGLRSIRLLIVSILPNVLPILTTFGTMHLLGIGLDPGTVMIASIALGIAVDDTIHTLTGYRHAILSGQSNHEAIRDILATVGAAISVTTINSCIGFFILAFSAFAPLHNFGLLAGIAMIIAMSADMFFVPALLAIIRQPGMPPSQMDDAVAPE